MHPLEIVCSIEHAIGCSPACVAVKGDLQWCHNAAFSLELLKILDVLARCLNLQIHESEMINGREQRSNLDCKGVNDGNYIQLTIEYMVARISWIIFPYGIGSFDNCDLCNVGHHIDVWQINHMFQASKGKLA